MFEISEILTKVYIYSNLHSFLDYALIDNAPQIQQDLEV